MSVAVTPSMPVAVVVTDDAAVPVRLKVNSSTSAASAAGAVRSSPKAKQDKSFFNDMRICDFV